MAGPPGETTQTRLGGLILAQPRTGYRFSMDSVLLAAFASLPSGPATDLGAGCGVLAVLLARRGAAGPFTALELDPLAAACCRANFAAHGLDGQVVEHDLNQSPTSPPRASQSLVISNPPFFAPGAGRVSPRPSRARARHGLAWEPEQIWRRAAELLPAGGRFAFCWAPARLAAALAGCLEARLAPKRLRLVHGRVDLPAKLALVEAVRDGGEELAVEPPLVVYAEGQEYSPEVAAIYRDLVGR